MRAAAASKPGTIQWDGSLPATGYWQRPLRGILAVVGVAALYFGLKSLVSKSWHIVVVLLLRYYLRGVALTGVGLTWNVTRAHDLLSPSLTRTVAERTSP